jgi:hypothetical protein
MLSLRSSSGPKGLLILGTLSTDGHVPTFTSTLITRALRFIPLSGVLVPVRKLTSRQAQRPQTLATTGRPFCCLPSNLPRDPFSPAALPLSDSVQMASDGQSDAVREARELVSELCRHFYTLGWVSGTGGSISLRIGLPSDPPESRLIVMAPSGIEVSIVGDDHLCLMFLCEAIFFTLVVQKRIV